MEPGISVRWQRLQRMLSLRNLEGFSFVSVYGKSKKVGLVHEQGLPLH